MTTVNYLDKTDLHLAFSPQNLDAASQQAIINQLIADGLYDNSNPDDGKSVWVESDLYNGIVQPPLFATGGNPTVPAFVQVLEVQGSITPVQTTSNLKVIVADGSNPSTLNVSGGNNPVFIALGDHGVTVNLGDLGSDTVLGGGGADSITANSGNDVLYGGGGNDTVIGGSGTDSLYGGEGNDSLVAGSGTTTLDGGGGDDTIRGGAGADSLYGGDGNDFLFAGSGHGSLLVAGGGNADQLTDTMSGGHDTLVAGSGNDTITGMQGDFFDLPSGTMVASGNDTYNILDGDGDSIINLGTGADTVNMYANHGNDTINHSGSNTDLINYSVSSTHASMLDIASITPGSGSTSGDYLIKFTDGAQVQLNAHDASSATNAFTLHFTDGNLNLKGGS